MKAHVGSALRHNLDGHHPRTVVGHPSTLGHVGENLSSIHGTRFPEYQQPLAASSLLGPCQISSPPSSSLHEPRSAVASLSPDYASSPAYPFDEPSKSSTADGVVSPLIRKRGRQLAHGPQKRQNNAQKRATAPPSKASLKRAEIERLLGPSMIGSNDGPKGMTRKIGEDKLEWFDPKTHKWRPAAPHDHYRQDFIDLSSSNSPYVTRTEHGIGPIDITSNCSFLGQNQWTFTRQGLADIKDGEGNKVFCTNRRPPRYQEYPEVEIWIYKGLVMLDPDDHPVLKWPGLPLIFSSNLEGGRMEALKRVFPWLKNFDIRARMPRMIVGRKGVLQPLPKYSTFGQRMGRFRARHGLTAWNERTSITERKKRMTDEATGGDFSSDEGDGGDKLRSVKRQRENCGTDHRVSEVEYTAPYFLSASAQENAISTQHDARVETTSSSDQSMSFSIDSSQDCINSPSSPIPINPDDTTNFWLLEPRSVAEASIIRAALDITRDDFRSYHGFEAPITPPHEAYIDQYNRLEVYHAEQWLLNDPPPSLVGVTAWEGSLKNWQIPSWARRVVQQRADIPSPTHGEVAVAQNSEIFGMVE